jgi:ribosomal protein S18 acetylase RimI-like enzyme
VSLEIDKNKFKSRAANKVACFAKLLRNKFEALLPSGAHKVCFIEIGGVANQYRGRGISQEMVKHSMRLAIEQFHCDYICTMADSKAAQKLFEQKLGYKLLREFKLDHYLDGKNPVFFCDTDELVSGKLYCKRL